MIKPAWPILLSGALLSLDVSAQQWALETTELRGIKIGNEFSYPECPKESEARELIPGGYTLPPQYVPSYSSAFPQNKKGIICFKITNGYAPVPGAKVYELEQLPFVGGVGTTAEVTVLNNRIEHIEVSFLYRERDQFYQAVMGKYGKPSSSSTKVFRNGYGHTFESRSLIWSGNTVTLFYDELDPGRNTDIGHLRMFSKTLSARMLEREKNSSDNIRKGL